MLGCRKMGDGGRSKMVSLLRVFEMRKMDDENVSVTSGRLGDLEDL